MTPEEKKLIKARKLVAAVNRLAKKQGLNFFIVTDGASGISNNGNPAVRNAREAQIKWELEHGADPYEDWSKKASSLDLKKLFPNSKFPTEDELKKKENSFSVGDRVKVSDNIRCRQKGHVGTIVRIDPENKHGWKSFVVEFDDKKYGSVGFSSGNIDKVDEKNAQAVDPDKWPDDFMAWQKKHDDEIVWKARKAVIDNLRDKGKWGLMRTDGRYLTTNDEVDNDESMKDVVIRSGRNARRSKTTNCHELAGELLARLIKNRINAKRVFVDKDMYNGIAMGHSTVFFQDKDGRWHRATNGMGRRKKSPFGDFDSLEDAIDQYIAVEKANKQTTDDERVEAFDTTDLPFTDRMLWPEYKALARTGKRLYHQEKKAQAYEPPWKIDQIRKNLGDKVADKLADDPVHKWRSDTGIELIHKEPTKEELERIIMNWKLMDYLQKRRSNKKSKELFGLTNLQHAKKLLGQYS